MVRVINDPFWILINLTKPCVSRPNPCSTCVNGSNEDCSTLKIVMCRILCTNNIGLIKYFSRPNFTWPHGLRVQVPLEIKRIELQFELTINGVARPQKNEFCTKKITKLTYIFYTKNCAYHSYYKILHFTVTGLLHIRYIARRKLGTYL